MASLLLMGVMSLYGVQELEFRWKVKDFKDEEELVVRTFMQAAGYGPTSKEYMTKTVHKETEKIVHGIDGAHGLSVYCGQNCVGFILVEYDREKNEIYIPRLAVCPTTQGRGLGKILVKRMYETFKPQRMAVIARRKNGSGIKFYKKLGFYETEWLLPGKGPEKYCGLWCDNFNG